MIDLFQIKQVILTDPRLSPEQRSELLAAADHAWTTHPGGVTIEQLTAIGFGALAGYIWSHLSGAGTIGTLANTVIGGMVGSLFAPHQTAKGYYQL